MTIRAIPNDHISTITRFLDPADVANLSATCSEIRRRWQGTLQTMFPAGLRIEASLPQEGVPSIESFKGRFNQIAQQVLGEPDGIVIVKCYLHYSEIEPTFTLAVNSGVSAAAGIAPRVVSIRLGASMPRGEARVHNMDRHGPIIGAIDIGSMPSGPLFDALERTEPRILTKLLAMCFPCAEHRIQRLRDQQHSLLSRHYFRWVFPSSQDRGLTEREKAIMDELIEIGQNHI